MKNLLDQEEARNLTLAWSIISCIAVALDSSQSNYFLEVFQTMDKFSP